MRYAIFCGEHEHALQIAVVRRYTEAERRARKLVEGGFLLVNIQKINSLGKREIVKRFY